MPRTDGLPPGTLVMLILRVLAAGPLHGYAIAQRIALLSKDELSVEEGSLYPALQKLLLKGWVKAASAVSDTGRTVRTYRLTPAGRKQLDIERAEYRRVTAAISAVLDTPRVSRFVPCRTLVSGSVASGICSIAAGSMRSCDGRWRTTAR